ncbi:putative lipase atg15 [Lunasporangiospora selenospora]|uniref:triacylglycerol lipase n=1 Tax=Lunasporangiospora selenospora TaxID=979761 RepID=A0A9P6G444_9FUNG|nr:putative lipase atg15 [Lunasporangiospora selenospora]
MATVRKRRTTKAPSRKVTRKIANKHKKKVNIVGNKIIRDNWDKKATLRQNYARLGLQASLNGLKGGVEIKDEEEVEEQEQKSLEEMLETLTEDQGIIQRDEQGNIVKVIVGKAKSKEEVQEMMERDLEPVKAKTDVVRALEARAANVLKRERYQSEGEVVWAAKLVDKHGDDYEKMFRDRKLNPNQQTVSQLKKRIASLQQQQHAFQPSGGHSATPAGGKDVPLPDTVVTLRHILHHGGNRYPQLFRKLDLSPIDIILSELLTGQDLTHRLKVKTTTTLTPRIPDDSDSDSDSVSGGRTQHNPSRSRPRVSFRSKGFRSMRLQEQSFGPESYTKDLIRGPDVMDKDTLVQLAMMNYNSYTEVGSPGWYDLEDNWGVNSTFGWEEDGVRGHVFVSKDNSTLIIAIKGTSAAVLGGGGDTAARDKVNDNLLFSCCCAKVDVTWKAVCDCSTGSNRCDQRCIENSVNSDDAYYNIAMSILWTVQDQYPEADVWLTGHSLGGGLSSLLGLTFGVPTVTFEVPGDRLAAQRLHLPGPPAINWYDLPLYHVGHTADPIFQGVCNGPWSSCYYSGFALESKCHTGRTCVYDPVKEDNWKIDIRRHRLADTIEGVLKVKTVPECKPESKCVDCDTWEFVDVD